jgi:uncharacterized membrane protein
MTRILQTLVRCFVVGVFAVLPLVITVGVVIWVSNFVANVLGPGTVLGGFLRTLGFQVTGNNAFTYAAGWLIVLGVIFGVGALVEAGARRFIVDKVDRLAKRIPVLGGVYGTVRQLTGMLDTKDKAELRGMRVVFCVFGQETGAAFLALLPTPERFRVGNIDYNAVLVPTAPVPFSGSLIFVPASAVHPSDLTVDAFMSIYVSMGVTGPQFLNVPPN